ncbi:MAG TPA: winged helix-turn-helix domain-containing protein [Rhizomicrobium sp.]|jgi:TolB-like protein/DNA-binding winged helix-turn-helix (wHTH) protein|nr:winged helix-turn-helix domain-containing protein [Rhizomicrobium sp.]
MDISVRDKGIFRFGVFRMDAVGRCLARDGAPLKLPPKLFDTLLYLVENAGRVVEKDELLTAVWDGRFVEEANLTQTVFLLRRILHSDETTADFIVTVPGHGYRFVARVERETDSGAAVGASAASHEAAPAARFKPPATEQGASEPSRVWSWPGNIAFIAAAILFAGVISLAVVQRWAPQRAPPGVHVAFNPPPRSVAVLAFTNMSGDRSQEYLADGFSEELINVLSRVDALHVAARTSAFFFKDHPATIADIARQLNVGAVLEGSVRREGQRLRITVQLINAATGYHFWSHNYDRDFGDVLKLQTEIAEKVTQSLQVTLNAGDAERLTMGGTANSAAFDAFLQGMRSMHGRDEASYRTALAAFDDAVRLDPRYAAAQTKRAYVLMFIANFDTTSDLARVHATMVQAMDAADRAVALAPDWAETHAARGAILLQRLDFEGAERELSRARAEAPGDVAVDRPYAYLEAYLGHRAAAEAAAARVVARYPLEADSYADQAEILYQNRRYDDSLAALRHARALAAAEPPRDQLTSALDYFAQGKPEMARQKCALDQNSGQTLCLAIATHQLGQLTEAKAHMAKFRAAMGNTGAYDYAEIYAQWGDQTNALVWLKAAYKLRDTGLATLRTDPLLDPIRGSQEFADIERRLNFPP